MTKLTAAVAAFVFGLSSAGALAADSHAGYYYPLPQTKEVYGTETKVSEQASARSRAAFAVGMATRQSKLGYPPSFHMFVKGEQLQKLIIVAVETDRYNTLYRFRALLASLTSLARGTPIFNEAPHPHKLNFFDFCKMMGFTQITITDGDRLTHQILLQ